TKEQERISRGDASEDQGEQGADAALATAAATATEEQPVTLRRSNTGLFTQIISQTRATEFELVEPGDSDRLFYELPARKKIAVMVAGPGVNILLAFICFLGVYGIYGTHAMEPTGSTVVTTVGDCVISADDRANTERTQCQEGDPATPARAAGLRVGDEIVGFNGQEITSWDQLSDLIHANGSGAMQLEVIRGGDRVLLQQVHTIELERDLEGDGELTTVGYLGVSPELEEVVTRHGPLFTLQRMGE